MVSHPETDSDPPIGSDRESGCDKEHNNNYLIPKLVPKTTINNKFVQLKNQLLLHCLLIGPPCL